MAVTDPTDVTSSIPEKYAKRVLREIEKDTFWSHLVTPEGGAGAFIRRDEVLDKPGETVHIQVTRPLTGAGISGDTATLEGSEESLSTEEITVTPSYVRHGVRVNRRAQKKSLVDLREEAVRRLGEWGRVKVDEDRFSDIQFDFGGTPGEEVSGGTPYIRYAGSATSDATVTASDVMTLAELSKTKYIIRDRKAKPWNVSGQSFYLAVIDPWQEYDLKVTDTAWAQAQREAQVRGAENPLFTGAVGIWDGVVILSADRVPSSIEANTPDVRMSNAMVFGQEAFVEAWGEKPDWAEDTFDYELEWGVAYGHDHGARRGFEYASTQLRTASNKQT